MSLKAPSQHFSATLERSCQSAPMCKNPRNMSRDAVTGGFPTVFSAGLSAASFGWIGCARRAPSFIRRARARGWLCCYP